MKKIINIRKSPFLFGLYSVYKRYSLRKSQLGFCGENVILDYPIIVAGTKNMYMYDNTLIYGDAMILCTRAKFIMKSGSGAARGLKVICGNHAHVLGKRFLSITDQSKDDLENVSFLDKDIVVEEDIWIGANVTLLSGVTIGRGATVGSGSVCRKDVPPYSVVIGNPAKVVRFNYTPQEIIEHEKILYPEDQRLPLYLLEYNYEKYYTNRIEEIKKFKQI